MTKFPSVIRDMGAPVYVRIGHGAVKAGLIYGIRVTLFPCPGAIHPRAQVEYQVGWLSKGERAADCEWFTPEFVCDTATHAFEKSILDDNKVRNERWDDQVPAKEGGHHA